MDMPTVVLIASTVSTVLYTNQYQMWRDGAVRTRKTLAYCTYVEYEGNTVRIVQDTIEGKGFFDLAGVKHFCSPRFLFGRTAFTVTPPFSSQFDLTIDPNLPSTFFVHFKMKLFVASFIALMAFIAPSVQGSHYVRVVFQGQCDRDIDALRQYVNRVDVSHCSTSDRNLEQEAAAAITGERELKTCDKALCCYDCQSFPPGGCVMHGDNCRDCTNDNGCARRRLGEREEERRLFDTQCECEELAINRALDVAHEELDLFPACKNVLRKRRQIKCSATTE